MSARQKETLRRTGYTLFMLIPFTFFVAMMLTDYGASLAVSGGHGESLIIPHFEPRIMYHTGLVLMIGAFATQTVFLVHYWTNTCWNLGGGSK